MNPEKLRNIQNLSPQDRYSYFIRKVADFEEVWLIQENDQYVTLGDRAEQVAIPVWPEKEFAALMLTDSWKDCAVERMEVYDFISWLEQLEDEGCQIACFPLAALNSVVV